MWSATSTTQRRLVAVAGPLLCAAALAHGGLGCAEPEPTLSRARPAGTAVPTATVQIRGPYWPTFPCTQCHEHQPGTANPKPRELRAFHGTRHELVHGSLTGWCYRCHFQPNLDALVLDDGRPVPFEQTVALCGSCHGEKLADWRNGIHGQTTGQWNGARVRRSCEHCHDSHRPKIGPMTAEPPPARPRTAAPSRPKS